MRNEWIIRKGVPGEADEVYWMIGDMTFPNAEPESKKLLVCHNIMGKIFPSLLKNTTNKLRVKVTRTAHKHATKLTVIRWGTNRGVSVAYEENEFCLLYCAARWMSDLCDLMARNQTRDIWVSFRKVK